MEDRKKIEKWEKVMTKKGGKEYKMEDRKEKEGKDNDEQNENKKT